MIDHLRTERKKIIDQLLNASCRVGELETKLLQLSVPAGGVAALEGDANAGEFHPTRVYCSCAIALSLCCSSARVNHLPRVMTPIGRLRRVTS